MHTTELITSAEAARRMGLSRMTVNRRVRSGDIPAAGRLPGRTGAWLFDPDVIDQLAREGVNQ
ncbi:helix-turn-helix transcriptional regulator [Corynebacterium glyciniphilum]|uniref:helix-turn-helix transcriptional regulator n=1 Tax=Corynebacterium glyciniphilum TaxID=1404244 RepID=UPI003FD09323